MCRCGLVRRVGTRFHVYITGPLGETNLVATNNSGGQRQLFLEVTALKVRARLLVADSGMTASG